MDNKKIIISGSGALAMAFAEKFSQIGFLVALLSKSKPENFKGLFINCDITQEQEVVNSVEAVYKEFGELNLAVHTAVSPITRKRFLNMSNKEFADSFLVDVFGGFIFFQAIAKIMKIQGFGKIVGLTSEVVEEDRIPLGMTGYVCAKFALKGLLSILKQEFSMTKIAVSTLSPGFMDTPLNKDVNPRLVEFIKEQQNGELITPDQVAEVLVKVFFLDNEECSGKNFHIRSQADVKNLKPVDF